MANMVPSRWHVGLAEMGYNSSISVLVGQKMSKMSIFLRLILCSVLGIAAASLVFMPFAFLAAGNGFYPYLLAMVLVLIYAATYFAVGKKLVFSRFADDDQATRIKWHALMAVGTAILAFIVSYLVLAGHVTKQSGNYELTLNDLNSSYFAANAKAKEKSLERSANLFKNNGGSYYVVPENSARYRLQLRLYQQARDEMLESRYKDTQSNEEFDVKQWAQELITKPELCLQTEYERCTVNSIRGGVAFCTAYTSSTDGSVRETICQTLLNDKYTLSVESSGLPKETLLEVIGSLEPLSTSEIELKTE